MGKKKTKTTSSRKKALQAASAKQALRSTQRPASPAVTRSQYSGVAKAPPQPTEPPNESNPFTPLAESPSQALSQNTNPNSELDDRKPAAVPLSRAPSEFSNNSGFQDNVEDRTNSSPPHKLPPSKSSGQLSTTSTLTSRPPTAALFKPIDPPDQQGPPMAAARTYAAAVRGDTSQPSPSTTISGRTGIRSIDSLGIDKETNYRIGQMDETFPSTASYRRIEQASTSDFLSTNVPTNQAARNTVVDNGELQELRSLVNTLSNRLNQIENVTDQQIQQNNSQNTSVLNNQPNHGIIPPTNVRNNSANSNQSCRTDNNLSYESSFNNRQQISSHHHNNEPANENRRAANQFNQNEFSLACNGKIKFNEIESSLKNKILQNDSPQALQLFYTAII